MRLLAELFAPAIPMMKRDEIMGRWSGKADRKGLLGRGFSMGLGREIGPGGKQKKKANWLQANLGKGVEKNNHRLSSSAPLRRLGVGGSNKTPKRAEGILTAHL